MESKIRFADENAKKAYFKLDTFFKQQLEKAFTNIQKNAFCGIQIPKRLIPKEYCAKYGPLDNLWKYNLTKSWRLVYTVKSDGIIILSIILEWFNHKEYERKFKY